MRSILYIRDPQATRRYDDVAWAAFTESLDNMNMATSLSSGEGSFSGTLRRVPLIASPRHPGNEGLGAGPTIENTNLAADGYAVPGC